MNFSSRDFAILVASAFALVAMSYTFPALGLAGGDEQINEIPELEVDTDRFDWAGDFPEPIETGDLDEASIEVPHDEPVTEYFITRPEIAGVISHSGGSFDEGDQEASIGLQQRGIDDEHNVDTGFIDLEEDEMLRLSIETVADDETGYWNVTYTVADVTDDATLIRYAVTRTPSGDLGFLTRAIGSTIGMVPILGPFAEMLFYAGAISDDSNIPIVGPIIDGLGWFIEVFIWWFTFLAEMIINLIWALVDATTYGFGLLAWLGGSYWVIVSGAESWAVPFVSLPALLFSLEFTKLLLIGVKVLPTT